MHQRYFDTTQQLLEHYSNSRNAILHYAFLQRMVMQATCIIAYRVYNFSGYISTAYYQYQSKFNKVIATATSTGSILLRHNVLFYRTLSLFHLLVNMLPGANRLDTDF